MDAEASGIVIALTQYIPLSILVGILYLSLQYYSRPHISFVELSSDAKRGSRFLLNSFEPITSREPLWIRIEAPLGLERVEVSGGPWFDDFLVPGAEGVAAKTQPETSAGVLPKALVLKFSGFPAEGTMSLSVMTPGAGAVRLCVDEQSVMKPRSFRPTPSWRSAKLGRTIIRSMLGAFTAIVLFNLCVPVSNYSDHKPRYVGFMALLLLGAPMLWTLVSPYGGKEIIQGFLGGGKVVTRREWHGTPAPKRETTRTTGSDELSAGSVTFGA